jgi:hypothetical protein
MIGAGAVVVRSMPAGATIAGEVADIVDHESPGELNPTLLLEERMRQLEQTWTPPALTQSLGKESPLIRFPNERIVLQCNVPPLRQPAIRRRRGEPRLRREQRSEQP